MPADPVISPPAAFASAITALAASAISTVLRLSPASRMRLMLRRLTCRAPASLRSRLVVASAARRTVSPMLSVYPFGGTDRPPGIGCASDQTKEESHVRDHDPSRAERPAK